MTGSGDSQGSLRITLVNQFYPPDVAPTAHLTASLAEDLAAQGHRVTVITGGGGYVDAPRASGRAGTGAVRVVGLWTPAMGKASVLKRLSDYLGFLAGATLRLVIMRRQDVVVSLTTPPYVVLAAVAHKLRHRSSRVVLWSMDCYPDVIERLGVRTTAPVAPVPSAAGTSPAPRRRHAQARARALLVDRVKPLVSLREGGPASTVLRALNRWAFRRVDHVVALDDAMADLLTTNYTEDDQPPVTVIPNWERLDAFPPTATAPQPVWSGYEDPALDGRFVVAYLGNLGYGHRAETAVDAAAVLATEDVAWLFMGGGARWNQLRALVDATGIGEAVVQRAYVPKEETAGVMAGAGAALILLAEEALGVMSPSKLHANLAAGLPIIYVGPPGSNVDAAIERYGCGVSLRPGDVDGVVGAVRRMRDDPPWRRQLGDAARQAFVTAYCDEATLPHWRAVIETVSGPQASASNRRK